MRGQVPWVRFCRQAPVMVFGAWREADHAAVTFYRHVATGSLFRRSTGPMLVRLSIPPSDDMALTGTASGRNLPNVLLEMIERHGLDRIWSQMLEVARNAVRIERRSDQNFVRKRPTRLPIVLLSEDPYPGHSVATPQVRKRSIERVDAGMRCQIAANRTLIIIALEKLF